MNIFQTKASWEKLALFSIFSNAHLINTIDPKINNQVWQQQNNQAWVCHYESDSSDKHFEWLDPRTGDQAKAFKKNGEWKFVLILKKVLIPSMFFFNFCQLFDPTNWQIIEKNFGEMTEIIDFNIAVLKSFNPTLNPEYQMSLGGIIIALTDLVQRLRVEDNMFIDQIGQKDIIYN